MTTDLESRIGGMLMFGWEGSTDEESLSVSEHARVLTDEFKVGGVILFARNVSTPEQVIRTVNEVQSRSESPLFVAVDQEGGMVARFKSPFAVFPGNMALGAIGSSDYARRAAQAIGRQLAAVGVNWDFAPCVDVNVNPDNPIIGVRSFGESPELVAGLGAAMVEGFQSAGVLSSAKHFPGHGDTSSDTHHTLPTIPYDRRRLDEVELVPFRAAIEAGVASIMTTHILFPALDETFPATLSERILTGLLREELGFGGIIITDCLQMSAIAEGFGAERAGVLAVRAGADMLLVSHSLDYQRLVRDGLLRAVMAGEIPESRIDESLERIRAAKKRFGLESRRTADAASAASVIGSQEIRDLEREIAEKAVTLVRNDDGLLPLKGDFASRIAVIGTHPATDAFASVVRGLNPGSRRLRADVVPTSDQLSAVDALIRESSAIIAVTCPREPWTKGLVDEDAQADLVNRILESGVPTVVVAAREPYGLRRFPNARTAVATYGYPDVSVRAAADLIFGRIPPSGKLPVSIPGYASLGGE